MSDTKRYILNTTVGDYNKGNVVTEDEISKLLNIEPCIKCGWLIPEQSKLQSQDKQVGWEILEFKTKDGHLAPR